MRTVIGIDPGVVGEGCAVARTDATGRLLDAFFARYPAKPYEAQPEVLHVVVERPTYQGARSDAARPKDLMALSWEGALLAAEYATRFGAPLVQLTPGEWKQSQRKPQMHFRLWETLHADERELLGGARIGAAIRAACERGAAERWAKPGGAYYPRSFAEHNLLDAVALVKVFLGAFR